MTQFVRSIPPIKVKPLLDESPSSWLLRISLKYHLPFRDLVKIYGLKELVNQPINITADLDPLSVFVPAGSKLPTTIQEKIDTFKWEKGRSEWLIEPNKNGSMRSNSYTRICPKCLRENGYYQLKWQLRIFEFCIEHSVKLVERCPKCKTPFSSTLSQVGSQHLMNGKSVFCCHRCSSSILHLRPRKSGAKKTDVQIMIDKAYSQFPINTRYLSWVNSQYKVN